MIKLRWMIAPLVLVSIISLTFIRPDSQARAQPPIASPSDRRQPSEPEPPADRSPQAVQKTPVQKETQVTARKGRHCCLKRVRHVFCRWAARRGK